MVVLDGSAVIVVLKQEPGADLVSSYLEEAAISAVNVQEIAKKMLEAGFEEKIIREAMDELGMTIMPHGVDDAFEAAALARSTRKFGSGLGDRSCMALAIRLGVPALTTDRAWAKIDVPGLDVVLVR